MSKRFYPVKQSLHSIFLPSLTIAVFLAAGTASSAEKVEANKQPPRIHAVSNIGHEFCFYADGSFHAQYLPGQPVAMSWDALYNFDFSNTNMLILLGCDAHLNYLPRDIQVIRKLLKDGGGVVLFGNAGDTPQNKLATQLGCSFKGRAQKPFKAVSDEITGDIKNDLDWGTTDWMELKSGQNWKVLIVDADNKPLLARKKVGKGTLLAAARGLSGSRPDGKDNINAHWWIPLLEKTAQGKKVDSNKPFVSRGPDQLEHMEELGSIKLYYSEYLKPYAQAMADIYNRTKPVIRERMGVPLSEGMASVISLLATGGGGFSSGEMLGLGVFWGGFPEREDSMIEFVTHEAVHSWVLPFAEIWNEPIATYVGNLVMIDMGYEEEGMRRIKECIDNAKKIDPTMKLYDLDGKSLKDVEPLTGDKMLEMRWGKTFWIFEELRQENPDIVADYFIAKRKLAQPGIIKKYDASATVAVVSVAMGKDMFGWFREYGFDVNAEKSEIKADSNRGSILTGAGTANTAENKNAPKPFGATPTAAQLSWQEMERNAFIHFGMNTFTDREWGDGKEDPKWFNPTGLDCRQWARTIKQAGMKGIVFTAKHHDGFCLWPSKYTEHSVKNSQWRNGKGDVVRELSDACKEYGVKFGIYLSPWDRHEPTYGTEAYNTYFKNQLTELLTHYGDIFEVWFDGEGDAMDCDWVGIYALVRKLQPHTVIMGVPGCDVRWAGSEHGASSPTHWHTLNVGDVLQHKKGKDLTPPELQLGYKGGKYWVPAEHDNSVRTRWFYHPADDGRAHSLETLIDLYDRLVGTGGVWLMNLAPDTQGLIPEYDAKRALELGKVISQTYEINIAQGAKTSSKQTRRGQGFSPENLLDGNPKSYWATDDGVTQAAIEIDLGKEKVFNRIVLQEHIKLGQRVEKFALDTMTDGHWQELVKGTTIGYKRILPVDNMSAQRLRLRIDKSMACPVLSEFGLYMLDIE